MTWALRSVSKLKFELQRIRLHSNNSTMTAGPISQKLFALAKQYIPGGVNSPVRAFRNVGGEPFFVRRAKGCRIWDVDGRALIDYVGTWGPAILGHAPQCVIEAMHNAAKDGMSFGIPNIHEVEMAKLICEWVPSVREGAHGQQRHRGHHELHPPRARFHQARPHREVRRLLSRPRRFAARHRRQRRAHARQAGQRRRSRKLRGTDDRAALQRCRRARGMFCEGRRPDRRIIVESYPANAGLILPQPGYLAKLREITQKHGALLIFDEVMTGFRVARGGVQEIGRSRPISPRSAKSSAAVCRSARSAGARTSWTCSRRTARSIRPAR